MKQPPFDHRTRAAWQTQLAIAARRPGLLPLLVRRRDELLPRFADHYDRLRRLSRRVRRALQRRWGVALATVALGMALGSLPAEAGTIAVGSGCALPDAIVAANTDATAGGCSAGSGDDTLALPPGSTHVFTASRDEIYGATALPRVTSTITIAGNGSTLRRDPASAAFRLLAIAPDGDLTLQDTTLSGGSLPDRNGGAIYNDGGALTLQGCVVTGNAARYGGGVDSFGGRVTISGSTIADNDAGEGGGGLFSEDAGVLIEDSLVTGNTAADGGGIGGYGYRNAVNVLRSTVSRNAANGVESAYGGGIAVEKSALAVADSTLSGNVAAGAGGGISVYSSPNASIDRCTIADNVAGSYGGGIDGFGSALIVWSSTLTTNRAAHGGGLSNEGEGGTLLVRMSTISGNTALDTGGGVYGSQPFLLGRSLISGNTAANTGAEVYSTASNTVYGDDRNLFGHDGVAGVSGFTPGPTDVVATGSLGSIIAPALADNGGPTRTLALVAGSPAIDAAPADDRCFATDQRGVARPVGAACDIGAFEGMIGGGGVAEVCGNCTDDDGDGRIDLADDDCASMALVTTKGAVTLKSAPRADKITLTAAFPTGPTFNPRLEGAGVSLFDASGTLVCLRIPPASSAPGAWKEKAGGSGTTWTFKDAGDGSLGDASKDALSVKCNTPKRVCTVKAKVSLTNVAGDGAARSITGGVSIGDDAWTRSQPWRSKSKGTKLVTP